MIELVSNDYQEKYAVREANKPLASISLKMA
jgi:hypothetical protein